MKKKSVENSTAKIFLFIIGLIYVSLGILSFYNAITYTETANVLWFSYFAFLFIGIGILTRNSYSIASQLNIIFLPYLIWNIDFFYVLFSGSSLWGITDYFFTPRQTSAQIITLQHIFIIPIALFSIYLIKLKRKDFWKFSLAQVTIFYFLVRIFGNPGQNVDCVFRSCLPIDVLPTFYPFFWFFFYMVMIALTTFLLTKNKFLK